MRRKIIRQILPLLICALPVALGALVIIAIPHDAMSFYLTSIETSYLDWVILGLGFSFFAIQLLLAWQALRWQEQAFNERPDQWIQRLHQAGDWFPLLGLFGTLVGILQTFAKISVQSSVQQQEIVRLYAPSLTTAASGLLMAFLNIMPLWLVSVGRGMILGLAVEPAKVKGETGAGKA